MGRFVGLCTDFPFYSLGKVPIERRTASAILVQFWQVYHENVLNPMIYGNTVLTVWVTEHGGNSVPGDMGEEDFLNDPERCCYGIYTSWEDADRVCDVLNEVLKQSEDAEVRNFRASIREDFHANKEDVPPTLVSFRWRLDVCEQFGQLHFN